MKALKIRDEKTGEKTSKFVLENVCKTIVSRAADMGFITGSEVLTDSSVNIGLHMRSFRIDVKKIGSNARPCHKSIAGFKKTDVPTWDQRKEFNALVNEVFSSFELSSNIVSGNYTVRTVSGGAVRDWMFGGDRNSTHFSANASADIMTLEDAIDNYDPDAKRAQHKEDTAPLKREQARLYRQHVNTLKHADFVGFYTSKFTSSGFKKVLNVVEFSELASLVIKKVNCFPLQGKTKKQAKNIHLVTERLKGGNNGN